MRDVPTTRPVSWWAVAIHIPLLVCLIGLTYALGFRPLIAMQFGAGLYLLYSFGSRAVLARHHKNGMRLVSDGDFREAIPHFAASYRFFEQYPWLDRWRALTMLSAAALSYREMALVNTAFCYGQIGDGDKTRAAYERALSEFPGSAIARTALCMIDSVSPDP